jgi:hypothetical protein
MWAEGKIWGRECVNLPTLSLFGSSDEEGFTILGTALVCKLQHAAIHAVFVLLANKRDASLLETCLSILFPSDDDEHSDCMGIFDVLDVQSMNVCIK